MRLIVDPMLTTQKHFSNRAAADRSALAALQYAASRQCRLSLQSQIGWLDLPLIHEQARRANCPTKMVSRFMLDSWSGIEGDPAESACGHAPDPFHEAYVSH
jgi:hypothetical protein